MNDRQKNEQHSGVRDQEIRAALDQHWAASDANDFETEHRIFHEDAVLDHPQSGERTCGRRSTQNQRTNRLALSGHPQAFGAAPHSGRALTVGEGGALSDPDNITVRIAEVAANLEQTLPVALLRTSS